MKKQLDSQGSADELCETQPDKATARPWEFRQKRGNNIYEHIIFANAEVIAELNPDEFVKTPNDLKTAEKIKSNAALIVKAVNEHAALEGIADLMDKVLEYHKIAAGEIEFAGLFDRFILEKARNLAAIREQKAKVSPKN